MCYELNVYIFAFFIYFLYILFSITKRICIFSLTRNDTINNIDILNTIFGQISFFRILNGVNIIFIDVLK